MAAWPGPWRSDRAGRAPSRSRGTAASAPARCPRARTCSSWSVATASGLHHAPTATAVGPLQLSLYGVTLHHVGTERVAGPDRYATAAAISVVAASPGVPTVVIASGTGFADGLGAAPAAAALHAPLLLVQPAGIPAATATELARLKPGRIVIVGGTASVSPAVAQALAHYTAGRRQPGQRR